MCEGLNVSERRARLVLGQYRSTQRHLAMLISDEDALTRAIVELATRYGRYCYRQVTGLMPFDANHGVLAHSFQPEGLIQDQLY